MKITKGIVELHHGRVAAECEGLGKGSTFYVELPLYLCISEESFESSVIKEADMSSLPKISSGENSLPRASNKRKNMLDTIAELNTINGASADAEAADKKGPTEWVLGEAPVIMDSYVSAASVSLQADSIPLRALIVDDSSMTRKMLKRLILSLQSDCVPGTFFKYIVNDVESGVECLKHICDVQSSSHLKEEISYSTTFKSYPETNLRNNSVCGTESITVPTNGRKYEENMFYNIIFIDNVMPGLSGPDTVRQLLSYYNKRSTRSTTPTTQLDVGYSRRNSIRELPFIVGVSGLSDEKDIAEFKLAGANIVLVKPLDGKKLIQVLEQYHQ